MYERDIRIDATAQNWNMRKPIAVLAATVFGLAFVKCGLLIFDCPFGWLDAARVVGAAWIGGWVGRRLA